MNAAMKRLDAGSRAAGSVLSKDGTPIAFDRTGRGPALILVDGALCYREMGPCKRLAALLARDFTVFTYDRRGRGGSGDTPPYTVEREVEDIAALLAEAGGAAFIWGMSSGGILALEAATRLGGIRKLALYEAPLILDSSRPATGEYWQGIHAAVAADRPGDAVRLFLRSVGMPGFFIGVMRLLPLWRKLAAAGRTLPYDGAIVSEYQRGRPLPPGKWASLKIPVVVMDGGKSPEWMRRGNQALAATLPKAAHRTLAGQTHDIDPKVLAPALMEFFAATGGE